MSSFPRLWQRTELKTNKIHFFETIELIVSGVDKVDLGLNGITTFTGF